MAKILLVEDDIETLDAVADALELQNHVVEKVIDGNEAADRLKFYFYDLVVLDWGLPGRSGIDICQEYRGRGGKTPVLMLTGRKEFDDRVHGLDAGADDYLPKPFNMAELIARTRALLRRPAGLVADVLSVQDVVLDLKTKKVTRAGVEIPLLAKELAVLEFLMRHCDQVFSVTDLLEKVWHSESDSTEIAVRQTITRLRKKLDADSRDPIVKTIKGLGYKIDKDK